MKIPNNFQDFIHRISGGDRRSAIVKKNIGYSLVIKGVGICLSFLIVPLTLGYVNAELYGVWLTLSSIMTWLTFFDIGFTQGLKNKLGEAIARDDWELGKKYVSTTYVMMVAIFIPLCVILEIIIPYFDWTSFLNVRPIYNEDIVKAMTVIIACFCLHIILGVLGSVISAFQKVALTSLVMVVGQFVSFVSVFLLSLFVEPSLFALSIAFSVMEIIVYIGATFIMFNSKFKKVAPSIKAIDRSCAGSIFNLGLKFFILQIQYIVYYQTTNFLISHFAGPSEVTVYNVAYKYLNIVTMIFGIIVSPLWPAFTEAFVKKDYVWMKSVYCKMTRLYWVINIMILAMLIISPLVYNLWVGDRVSVPFLLTTILSFYVAVTNWATLNVYIINGSGRIQLQTYITSVGMILFVPVAIVFAQKSGTYGVIISLLIVNTILAIVYSIQVSKMLANKASGIWIR